MLARIPFGLILILNLSMASSLWGVPIPGAALWLDAQDIDGDGNSGNNPLLGAPVSTWVDKAGTVQGLQNAVQGSGAIQPTYTPAAQNGQAAVTFTNDELVAPTLSLGAFTYFIAFRGTVGSPLAVVFERSVTANSNSGEYFVDSTGNTFRVTRGANSFGREYVANWGKSATILTSAYRFDGTVAGSTLHVNGALVALTGGGSDPGTGVVSDSLYIGRRSGGVAPFTGDIAELVAYPSAMSNAEVNITDNYLASKYNASMAANDFYAGDTALKGDYDFGVFGIGRATDGSVVTSGSTDGLAISESGGTLGSNEWVLAGHKTAINSINPDGTWARVWYIDKTETTGIDATLTFDFSDAGLVAPTLSNSPWTMINLLYSPTDPFSFSSLGIVGSASGDQVSFLVPNAQLLDGYFTLQTVTVPEPSTFALLGLGLVGLAAKNRRRRRAA